MTKITLTCDPGTFCKLQDLLLKYELYFGPDLATIYALQDIGILHYFKECDTNEIKVVVDWRMIGPYVLLSLND